MQSKHPDIGGTNRNIGPLRTHSVTPNVGRERERERRDYIDGDGAG